MRCGLCMMTDVSCVKSAYTYAGEYTVVKMVTCESLFVRSLVALAVSRGKNASWHLSDYDRSTVRRVKTKIKGIRDSSDFLQTDPL